MNKFEEQIINEIYSDNKEHKRKEIINTVMYKLNNFTKEELEEKTKNGHYKIYSEIDWAISHLKENGYSLNPKWGIHIISDKGIKYLKNNNNRIISKDKTKQSKLKNRASISESILNNLKNCSNDKFEEIICELISKMGYGKFVKITKKTRDDGVDGIISEDPLGLHNTYIQAKKWTASKVGVKEIREFKGALNDKNATTGVLISTSNFTEDAKKSAENSNIKLINGNKLSKLMMEYNLGIKTKTSYYVDNNYFT